MNLHQIADTPTRRPLNPRLDFAAFVDDYLRGNVPLPTNVTGWFARYRGLRFPVDVDVDDRAPAMDAVEFRVRNRDAVGRVGRILSRLDTAYWSITRAAVAPRYWDGAAFWVTRAEWRLLMAELGMGELDRHGIQPGPVGNRYRGHPLRIVLDEGEAI